MHYGRAQQRANDRAVVLTAAHLAHPERFVGGAPRPPALPSAVWINKAKIRADDQITILEIYRRLGVGEVWFWINDEITVHVLTVLTDFGNERRTTSACLPGFNFALVAEMLALPSLNAVRKALRERSASASRLRADWRAIPRSGCRRSIRCCS